MNLSKLIGCPDSQMFFYFHTTRDGWGRGWSVSTNWRSVMRRGRETKGKALNRETESRLAGSLGFTLCVCRIERGGKMQLTGKFVLMGASTWDDNTLNINHFKIS